MEVEATTGGEWRRRRGRPPRLRWRPARLNLRPPRGRGGGVGHDHVRGAAVVEVGATIAGGEAATVESGGVGGDGARRETGRSTNGGRLVARAGDV